MTAPLSPERRGRITGSRVGAVLGLNHYQTRADVLREMVRDWHGAEPEFTGNEATEWGTAHEEDARDAFERTRGVLVLDAQDFFTHPEHPFLGVSVDGLVGDDGIAEFKSPFRARYTSLTEKPDYWAQVQLQLACTGRSRAWFVIWRPAELADRLGVPELIVEEVPADPAWLPMALPSLAEFHQEFQRVVADEQLSAPYLAPIERADAAWASAATRFRDATAMAARAKTDIEQARADLIRLAGEQSAKGLGVQVIKQNVKGRVDYARAVADLAPDADLAPYIAESSVRFTVRTSSEGNA